MYRGSTGTVIAFSDCGLMNMNPIRVLKFVNQFFIGGTERQFVEVANGLDRSRFAVEIACFRREGPLLDNLKHDMPLHTYPLYRSLYHWRSIRSQFRLMKDVRHRQFDIVHTYGWYPNVFGIPPSRLARRPAIIASVRDAGAYMTPAKIQALKVVCGLADCVVANSKAGRDWLIGQGVNERKIEVIRNGIAVPRSREPESLPGFVRKEFGIPQTTPLCACIGRVVSGKGIDFYLRAARILRDRGRDARFLMIGAHSAEEHYQSEMDALVRELNVKGSVIFMGQRKDVPAILREVDIVVHPSLTEGLSNVILEAMAAGLPVVATRTGGNPELVQNDRTGLLVSTGSAEEIAAAISRLLDQPSWARSLGEQARRRVIDEFTIDRTLAELEGLYSRLLRSGRNSSESPNQSSDQDFADQGTNQIH
jgi:glycosyltransferase involved in cell wall biosynthesis